MFTKIINLPNSITQSDIAVWLTNFTNLFRIMTGISFNVADLELEFSNSKVRSDGCLLYKPLGEIKDEILNLLGKRNKSNRDVFDLIDAAPDIATLRKLASLIAECMMDNGGDYKFYLSEIDEILGDYTDNPSILYKAGIYRDSEKKIILYIPVIEEMARHYHLPKLSAYESVLAHELFHAGHYYASVLYSNKRHLFFNELKSRHDYTSKVIKESLASYFENKYYNNHRLANEWMLDILKSPYSGARYILDDNHFRNIFDVSLGDLDNALRCLCKLDLDVFYRIKNATYVQKVKTNIPSTINVNKPFIITETPCCTHYGAPVYLLPADQNDFYNNIKKFGCFSVILVLKDGSIQSYTCPSKNISDADHLISNIKTQSLTKKRYNPKVTEVEFILAVCGAYNF